MIDLLPRLKEKGHDVDLLLFDGTDTPFLRQAEAVGIHVMHNSIGSSVYNPINLFKLIPYLRKYDLVHTHNTAPQLFAALGKVFGTAKLVTTEHNTTNRRRNLRLLKYIDKWIYNRYSHVICISQKAEDNLRAYLNSNTATISTINNGVCLDIFIDANPSPDLEKIAPDTQKIVMVAGFRPQKDQDTLILSMKNIPKRIHLFLIGDGERRSECESLAKVNGVADRVHFLGLRIDIPNLLKAGDYIVMSSHYEGLSLSSVEGMCVGKPFIASNVDGLREVVKGAGLLFEHQDAVGFAKLIQQIDADSELYKTVAARCRERANQFDISKMVEGYNNIYETI